SRWPKVASRARSAARGIPSWCRCSARSCCSASTAAWRAPATSKPCVRIAGTPSPSAPPVEVQQMTVELNTESTTLQRIKSGKLVEGLEHMSPTYLEGIRRILTVSADTELISAPAYFRAAQDAPSLNAFGTAISIVQDELAHAHIAYRLLEDLGVDKDWLIYQRPAGE